MKRILVIFGSSSDAPVYNKIAEELKKCNLSPEVRVISAHRTPNELDELLKSQTYDGIIAGAGLAAHLPGVIAAKVTTPIIGVPCSSNFEGLDSLLSIMQMPPGIPVLTVGVNRAEEAAQNMSKILEKHDSVVIVSTQDTKAVSSCQAILEELNISFKKDNKIDAHAINICFEPHNSNALVINVPSLDATQATSAPQLLDITKQGLWVGINRGENAALAAVSILGEHEKLKQYREILRKKVIDTDRQHQSAYRLAGVDIDAADEAVERLKKHVRTTYTKNVLSNVGSFGGLFELSAYKKPVLVSSTDGVGTKVRLAWTSGKHDTIGQDLVNHCVNDILVQGATPLFFMDYIGTGKVYPEVIEQLLKGMSLACVQTGTSLVKGEIAEINIYKKDEYDIVGAIVGVVEKDEIVTGQTITLGDAIIVCASNGLHTNGYTLALKIFSESLNDYREELSCTIHEALRQIHTCYLPAAQELWKNNIDIKGMAHITGGGLVENIPRILPETCDALIVKESWNILPIFKMLQKEGNITEEEMFRVFNMGIGFVMIVSQAEKQKAMECIKKHGIDAYDIGMISSGSKNVIFSNPSMTLDKTDFTGLGEKYEGKVRDNYSKNGQRTIITTDRLSAFDRILCSIPLKGQVLNQMAQFWFEQTKDIFKNHVIAVPDPNVMVVKECTALPVEMVVRAYLTGSTTTSAWYNYQNGVRNFCGNILPDNMKKDQKFNVPILTPSTKAEKGEHDESVSKAEILKRKLVTEKQFDELARISFALFKRGQEVCAKQGIILVDTKYEFGTDEKGNIVLIDEIHTPDSSRFWFADSYSELFEQGKEQRKIDKEYVRLWLAERGFRGDGPIPDISEEVKQETSRRYIQAYELITGKKFVPMPQSYERIKQVLQRYNGQV